MSIANLAMLTGHLGRPGVGVCPIRGQNNVQGACDMGALPNVYSGYQSVTDKAAKEKHEKAWGAPMPDKVGLKIPEMFEAAHEGTVKSMYILGENPVLTDPNANHIKEALEKLEFLVVQELFLTETAQYADVVLPGASFAEKDGTFTNTERRPQRVRKAVEPLPGKADWEVIGEMVTRMGYPMSYNHPGEIWAEMASLSPSMAGISYERMEKESVHWHAHSAYRQIHPRPGRIPAQRAYSSWRTARQGLSHSAVYRPCNATLQCNHPVFSRHCRGMAAGNDRSASAGSR
jgi:formate dehydrogenase alpha subunit